MINVFDFFNSSNGREALKRALVSSDALHAICGSSAYTSRTECPFEDVSDCSLCPFDMEWVSTIQKVRSLWISINMHCSDDYDWYQMHIKHVLSNILCDLTHDWVFHRDIVLQLQDIESLSETIRLLEIIVSICDEIEEQA